jgi:cellulose synthase/poly-beta-1,6-N-acetylglucosamine synthase-like glycosyltransferase
VTAVAALLLLLALWLAVWSYVLYPAWIRRLAARAPARAALADPPAPSIEVLVSAADEEERIADRVRDLLRQEAPGRFGIAIGCDGCTDATAERARAAAPGDRRVRVVEFAARRGKASVVNDLVATSDAELLVFTDANTRFEPGAVSELARAAADPRVGAVCGRLILEAPGGHPTTETLFWDRETRLKEAEGRLGVCLGANGAIYAARRPAVAPLPADSVLDDFLIPARIAAAGGDVAFAGAAVAREELSDDPAREMSRRFRIGAGAGQVLRRERWLWSRRRPLVALVFFSRKAARWLAPIAALGSVLAAAASVALRPAGLAAIGLSAVLIAAGRSGMRLPGAAGRLYYFAVINLALAGGVLAGLAGYRRPAWRPAARPD